MTTHTDKPSEVTESSEPSSESEFDRDQEPVVAQQPLRRQPVAVAGGAMESGVATHSREVNPARFISSAAGVGGTGQGAILASGQVRTRAHVPETEDEHHVTAEEAVARMQRQPWPPRDPRTIALLAHMSGGDVNPSPTEFWFVDGVRQQWAMRAQRNWNQQ
jgi:hypothetical protein